MMQMLRCELPYEYVMYLAKLGSLLARDTSRHRKLVLKAIGFESVSTIELVVAVSTTVTNCL
jgi:hypothetical protein